MILVNQLALRLDQFQFLRLLFWSNVDLEMEILYNEEQCRY